MGIVQYVIILIINVILMLIATLFVATLTLIERKILALLQRRVGPYYVGYRGRLQFLADALKLFVKGIIVPDGSSKLWFVLLPAVVAGVCYSFWINSIWGPNLSIYELEYNIVFASLLSIIFSFCIVLTGYFSRNKYALLASVRCCLLVLNLEIFLGLLFLNLVLFSESFCFSIFNHLQENYWLIFTFFGTIGLIAITFLLETNRAPFDLAEAESELIVGYSVEYGGFYFALFYLGEYLHLLFFSLTISLLLFGGWELPSIFFFKTYYYIF